MRAGSEQLLLRALVHESYYNSNMPDCNHTLPLQPAAAQASAEGVLPPPQNSGMLAETANGSCHSMPTPAAKQGAASAQQPGTGGSITFATAHSRVRSLLELLGDAVLNMSTLSHLMARYPLAPIGDVSRMKASVRLVFLGPPIAKNMSLARETQISILANSVEALLGAIHVEQGMLAACEIAMAKLLPLLVPRLDIEKGKDPVTLLQERSLKAHHSLPVYKLVAVDHENMPQQMCRVRVYVNGIRLVTGIGSTATEARRDGAQKALQVWVDDTGRPPV
eukprot:SM000010S04211  [mRNA]  locus=s10:228647:231915:- [translate_table: standard]